MNQCILPSMPSVAKQHVNIFYLDGKICHKFKMLGTSLLLEFFYVALGMATTLVTKGVIYCKNNSALSLRVRYL